MYCGDIAETVESSVGWRIAIAVDWQTQRLVRNSSAGTTGPYAESIGGQSQRAYTKPAPRHPTSTSQHAVVEKSSIELPGTSCVQLRSEHVAVCQRHSSVLQQGLCCSSPHVKSRKHAQQFSSTRHLMNVGLSAADEASRSFHCEQTIATCLSTLRSDDIVTPSRLTCSLAVTVLAASCSDGRLLPKEARPYFDPAQSNSILSAFSFRRFADVQCPTYVIQSSSRTTPVDISPRRQWIYS